MNEAVKEFIDTLEREIDALGGIVETEYDKGYDKALEDVLKLIKEKS